MLATMAVKDTPPPPAGPSWRLRATVAALGCAAAVVAAVHAWVGAQVRRDLGWFKGPPAAGDFSAVELQKLTGVAVQAEAFRNAEFLPLYGSSELTQPQPNRPDDFFRARPTGFDVFPVAYPGETDLVIATKLAALGPVVRGQKAVVFLSPSWFQMAELDPKGFGFNFSPLQGSRTVFGSGLSAGLKRDFARRLLDYPGLIGQYPLLKASLGYAAVDGTADRLLFDAMTPLGALQNLCLDESDRAKVAAWLHIHPVPPNGPPAAVPANIDWEARLHEAEEFYQQQPATTTYSTTPRTTFDDKRANAFRDPAHPEASPDANFERVCLSAKEWTDLDLLLRTTHELNLRLLLVCQPLNANFAAVQGLSARSTEFFYRRLQKAVAPYPTVMLQTFPQAEHDPHWFVDSTHPTAKAWLAYDRALDAFYHAP